MRGTQQNVLVLAYEVGRDGYPVATIEFSRNTQVGNAANSAPLRSEG